MQNTRQSEPIHPTVQPRDDIEQLSTNQRRHVERLFEYENINYRCFYSIFNSIFERRSAPLKPTNGNSKDKDTYVS